MAFRWLGWQLGFFEWQRGCARGAGGAWGAWGAPALRGGASVHRVEGAWRCGRRLRLLAVVDGLVVAETVQTRVNPPANVTHGLSGRSHVNVLDVPLEPRQRREALVTRLTSVIFLGGACATCMVTTQAVSPVVAPVANNALSYRSL
ncbi:unnamed protein product [Arctia plantaginis]|uniref:Uncharacterized protein n=1 Tax=Arctia plantaginis TaxID=874455 RepID=A0A8S0Z6C0_ARCPL|nr:unnamed protein product [Arctia plantaginis]